MNEDENQRTQARLRAEFIKVTGHMQMTTRKSKHEYLMGKAEYEATMNTCPPRSESSPNGVGAVIARGKRVIASGFNGSPPGSAQCDEVGHEMADGHCIRTIHAEMNAILQCARFGPACDGAVLYCTVRPCYDCLKAAAGVGIKEIYYRQDYNSRNNLDSEFIFNKAKEFGITLTKLEKP